jgi:Sua5/YciO/YrdC/YwlC family protein
MLVAGSCSSVGDRVNAVERLTVSPANPDARALAHAADILARGGLVVFPTDTLYGLAADPRNACAVERVFRAKGRSAGQALPLIAASLAQVEAAATSLSPLTRRLAERFWPGPLALVVDAVASIVPGVHGGTGAVAIRVPDHAVARGLASQLAFPIVSTSANRSGEEATSTVGAAMDLLDGMVDLVLDSGPTTGGEPSTVVDARTGRPQLLRAGAVPFASVLEVL